jgi:hypothetical protein
VDDVVTPLRNARSLALAGFRLQGLIDQLPYLRALHRNLLRNLAGVFCATSIPFEEPGAGSNIRSRAALLFIDVISDLEVSGSAPLVRAAERMRRA